MAIMFLTFNALLGCMAVVSARDNAKFMKTVPTITDSLVNLGKMEISFYFNGKHADSAPNLNHKSHTDYYTSPPAGEEICPCTNYKPSGPSFLSDPTEIVNKILKSNDLFKDPSSSICCDSLEHMQENTVVFELNPNNIPGLTAPRSLSNLQTYPSFIQSPISIPTLLSNKIGSVKPKAIEIFMFPRKKDVTSFETNFFKPKKDPLPKPNIQAVGDKEINLKQPSASVKKDLALTEKKFKQDVTVASKEELQTDAPPVKNFNNRL